MEMVIEHVEMSLIEKHPFAVYMDKEAEYLDGAWSQFFHGAKKNQKLRCEKAILHIPEKVLMNSTSFLSKIKHILWTSFHRVVDIFFWS